MKGTGTSATAILNIDPSSSRRGDTRAGGGWRGRAVLRAAAAGTALLALAALIAGCPLCNGTDVGCEDGVQISGPIGLAANASAQIEVRACWNGRCGEATLSSDPGDLPSSPSPIPSSASARRAPLARSKIRWPVDRRWEPGAGNLHAGLCPGGDPKGSSLPGLGAPGG